MVPLNWVIPTSLPVAPMPPLLARSVTSWSAAFLAQKIRGQPNGQLGSEPELSPFMLPDLSITNSTSLMITGAAPHGPPQAADETAPELPLPIPTTLAKAYWVVELPPTTTTLQRSPTKGLQLELRVGPAPVNWDAVIVPREWLGSQAAGMSLAIRGPLESAPIRQRKLIV